MATAPRLTAAFWISAYRLRLQQAGIPAFITARGDDTAGAIMVKCATLDGRARVWRRVWDMAAGLRQWELALDGPEPEADALLARERRRDPDLWVVELEDRAGRSLLDEEGLAG